MTAFVCKVSIKDRKPLIWWKVVIPTQISFSALSLLLEDLTGEALGDEFQFEIHRTARIWELSETRPLKSDAFCDAYSAAHTSLRFLLEPGRTVYVRGAGNPLKLEVEKQVGRYPYSFPVLEKLRADVDGNALFQRLKTRFVIRPEDGPALRRKELLLEETDGVLSLTGVSDALEIDVTYKPSTDTYLKMTGAMLRAAIKANERSGSNRSQFGK